MAERRRNPLTGDWVIVSPGRNARPWQGEASPVDARAPDWSADCYLCPRNRRVSGIQNPDYRGPYVFDNDFSALDASGAPPPPSPLFESMAIDGRCRVICYSERHDQTLADLDDRALARVVDTWRSESIALKRDHAWVQIFENKGRMMGASSEHPHGQIWASSVVPTIAAREDEHQRSYAEAHRGRLLLDYAKREVDAAERIVVASASWLAVVPYWAAWPYEVMLLPRVACGGLDELDDAQASDLAIVLGRVLRAYDRIFGISFPYSMGWHGRGRDLGDHWQLHAHFFPPLLRSPSVRKFMVGFEMLAESQRDLTPEAAAARLRDLVS